MKVILVLLTLFLTEAALSKDLFVYTDAAKTKKVNLTLRGNVRFNGGEQSKALKVIDRVIKLKVIEYDFDGRNPAVILCELYEGVHEFSFDSSGNQVPLCGFDDKSFFVSWDLFKDKL